MKSLNPTNLSPQKLRIADYFPTEQTDRSLSKILSIEHFFRLILEELDQHLPMESGCIAILNKKGKVEIKGKTQKVCPDEVLNPGIYQKICERIISTGQSEVVPTVQENQTGTLHVLGVPISRSTLVVGSLCIYCNVCPQSAPHVLSMLKVIASIVAQTMQFNRLTMNLNTSPSSEWTTADTCDGDEIFRPRGIVGNSKEMQAVYDLIWQLSRNKSLATILILGESGVGKELIGNAIHQYGPRASKPFIKVNCAALPETLLESELFGHERGAFTGAVSQKKGRFELADGGTIFLDEISEFSLSTQVKLLRVLQEREFERVGGTTTIKTNVQIIAATNRDLEPMIAQDLFRQDLYYRLNVFPIHTPPLRERKTDILLLADHFVEKYSKIMHKPILRISTSAIDMLMAYHWPGNVRELENCIERASLLCTDRVIHSHHLPPSLQTAEASDTGHHGPLKNTLGSIEKDMILDGLKSAHGNMAKAARDLGLTERIMQLRIKKYRIDPKRFKC